MGNFFHTVLYVPIYNLLVFIVDVIPYGDFAVAIILATLVIRALLWPLSMSAARSQKAMKVMEPEMKVIRETHKDNPEVQMKEMMALYKRYDVHPAASFLSVLVQLPIIIGLYWVFQTKTLPQVDAALLYPFIHAPEMVSVAFLGIATITAPNVLLAILAALTQLAHAWYAIPVPPASVEIDSTAADRFGRMMALQMRFILPVVIGIAAYASGAIAIYFITSSLVSIFQEFIVRRGKPIVPKVA